MSWTRLAFVENYSTTSRQSERSFGVLVETFCIIEFDIEKRNIHHDGKPMTLLILRVTSYNQK
jgi:hypothetical protein